MVQEQISQSLTAALPDDSDLSVQTFVDTDHPTMIKFNRFLQTYIINEGDIKGTCSKQCKEYKYVSFSNGLCDGALMDCEKIDEFGSKLRDVGSHYEEFGMSVRNEMML